MGAIVKNWITNKLGLEIPHASDPAAFRYEVANGILISEILRKYGLLSDDEFISLRHSNSSKSRIENMQHVHKWLVTAGMNLDESLMMDVAQESPGCAVKFLYELFLWLENGPRKKNVGEKAKKFLTERKPAPPSAAPPPKPRKHIRKGAERMSVLSSTWLHSSQAKSSSSEQELVPDDDSTAEKIKKIIKLPNWSTSLDPSTTHQHSKSDPYNELSEAAQAEAIYFTEQILDTYKKQTKIMQASIAHAKVQNNITPILEDDIAQELPAKSEKLKFRTKAEVREAHIAKAKLAEKEAYLHEINKFEKKLKQKKKENISNDNKTNNISTNDKIYHNGKGCKSEFRKSVQQLKCRRQKEVQAGIERNNCRKRAINRIIEAIPKSMNERMQDDILKLTTSFSTNEKLLIDFINYGHQEKNLFKQHIYYEAIQRQNARNFELDKSIQIEQEEKEFKREALIYKREQPVQFIYEKEPDQDEAEETIEIPIEIEQSSSQINLL